MYLPEGPDEVHRSTWLESELPLSFQTGRLAEVIIDYFDVHAHAVACEVRDSGHAQGNGQERSK